MGGVRRGSSEEPAGQGDDGMAMAPMVLKEEERTKAVQPGAAIQARKRLNNLWSVSLLFDKKFDYDLNFCT